MSRRAFTIIELIVVIVILGILLAVFIPALNAKRSDEPVKEALVALSQGDRARADDTHLVIRAKVAPEPIEVGRVYDIAGRYVGIGRSGDVYEVRDGVAVVIGEAHKVNDCGFFDACPLIYSLSANDE